MFTIGEIKDASEATEKALSFILEKHPMRGRIARPVKAVRENNVWSVEFNVGIARVLIAVVKLDALTGNILEYKIPQYAEI